MKKELFSLSIATMVSLIGSATAFANGGTEHGNGGNAAVCFRSSADVRKVKENGDQIGNDQLKDIVSIKALDLYQAESSLEDVDSAKFLVLPKAGEKEMTYVGRIARRFDGIVPKLADRIREEAAVFESSKRIHYSNGGIDRIDDAGEKFYMDPSKCVIATVIRRTVVGNELELEYDWRLYNHRAHSNVSRGVLMLHEVIYKWAVELGRTTSLTTRRFLANVLLPRKVRRSQVIEELNAEEFVADLLDPENTPEWRSVGGALDDLLTHAQARYSTAPLERECRDILTGSEFRAGHAYLRDFSELESLVAALNDPDPRRNGYFLEMKGPKNDDLENARETIERLEWQLSNSGASRSERKALEAKIAELRAQLPTLTAEADAESILMIEKRGQLIEALRAGYARFARDLLGIVTTYLHRLDIAKNFDPEAAIKLREYAECEKSYYSGPPQEYGSRCRSPGYSVFTDAWSRDRAIPVIE